MFYDDLNRIGHGLPLEKLKIIIGNFIAKIGRGGVYRTIRNNSLHRKFSQNWNKLVMLAAAKNMVVSSTIFPHKNIHTNRPGYHLVVG